MSNLEHLIENALLSGELAKVRGEDGYKAFEKAMGNIQNEELLGNVSISKETLWEIVQYIAYTYCYSCRLKSAGFSDDEDDYK